jgi:hypothetical protein
VRDVFRPAEPPTRNRLQNAGGVRTTSKAGRHGSFDQASSGRGKRRLPDSCTAANLTRNTLATLPLPTNDADAPIVVPGLWHHLTGL